MDKIFFLSHKTTQAIKRSQEFLNNSNLFGTLSMDSNLLAEGNVILGLNDGDSDDDEGEDVVFKVTAPTVDELGNDENESEGEEIVVTMSFGEAVLEHWNRRKTKIEHQYAIAAWAFV
jgi:hypothetical protein